MRQVNLRLLRSLFNKSGASWLEQSLLCPTVRRYALDVSAVLDLVTGRKINTMVVVEFDTDGKVQPPLHRRYSLQKASLAWRQLG